MVEDAEERKFRKWLKKSLTGLAKLLVAALIVGGAIFAGHYFRSEPVPIPKGVRQSVSFNLYYPSKLPSGYKFDKTSLTNSNNVVFYAFNNAEANQTITVSLQALPDNFDPQSTLKNSISATLPTAVGNAYFTATKDQDFYTIATPEKTLIFVRGNHQAGLAMQSLIQKLQPVKK